MQQTSSQGWVRMAHSDAELALKTGSKKHVRDVRKKVLSMGPILSEACAELVERSECWPASAQSLQGIRQNPLIASRPHLCSHAKLKAEMHRSRHTGMESDVSSPVQAKERAHVTWTSATSEFRRLA